MADNTIANAIKFLKGEEKSLPATKTEGQVYFAYKNVGTAEKPSYTGAIYIDTPIGGTPNRVKMTANADIAEYAKKANADSQGNLITGYLRNASLTGNADSQTFTFSAPGGAKFDLKLNGVSGSQAGLVTSGDQIFPGYKTLKLRAKPSSIVGSDNENSDGWYKVATSTMRGHNNTNILYYVKNGYSSEAVGILDFEMRSNDTSIQCWACKWLVRGAGFTSGMFRVVIDGMTWTLYAYQPVKRWGRISITEISNTNESGDNPNYKITYYNSTTKETIEPDKTISSSDGGQVYLASKATSDGNGQNIANTYIKSLSYSNDGKQLIATRGSGDTSLKLSLPVASLTKSGIVTTDAQSFGGTKTFTTINSTNLTVTGSSGFSYTGIEIATGNKARPVWFAYVGTNGKPVVNANFTYNPATQTLSVANLSGTAQKASNDDGGQNIRSTYVKYKTIKFSAAADKIYLLEGNGAGSSTNTTIGDSNISTAIIPAATDKAAGVITTGTQTFSGEKKFNNTIFVNDCLASKSITGTNITKLVLLSTPNANIGDASHTTSVYFKALLKWICSNYPNKIECTFLGKVTPSSKANTSIFIYNTSQIDATSGLPQYSSGSYTHLGGNIYTFGTYNYAFYFRESLMSDDHYAGSASPGGAATSANKLTTARTLWGQSFDGSSNVSGQISGCTRIMNTNGDTNNNLYLGNANNKGWVYVQNISSQTSTDKWTITQSGQGSFVSINIGYKYSERDSSYALKVKGNSFYSGKVYFANNTTYYINESADANLRAVGTSDKTYIAFPQGGGYRTAASTATGYLKITLPKTWSNTMMSFKVTIYEFQNNLSCTYYLSGYNYNSSGGKWSCVSAYSLSKSDSRTISNRTVRFGHDGSKCAIYIGENNSTWNFPQIQISDITVGYSTYDYVHWASGWSIGFTTTLGTITSTVTTPCISNSAATLQTNAGSATRPVYFSGGIPVQCNNALNNDITGKSASTNAINWVAGNEIRFTKPSYTSPQALHFGWAWADNSKTKLISEYRFNGGDGQLTQVTASQFNGPLNGNANTATALTSSAGSSTQPVYFSGGKPVACTYTINASVPSGAKFTDTNTWRPLGTTADTACAGNDSRLSNARPASDVYAWAKASTKPTYSWGEITGKPSTFTPSSHTHYSLSTIGDQRSTATTPDSYHNAFIFQGLKNNSTIGITDGNTYSYVLGLRGWGDASGGGSHELAFNSTLGILTRSGATTWNAWRRILDSSNYTSYTVTKGGAGASGTWGISISGSSASCTGNAATATKLQTARTISLTGSITGSGTFDGSGNLSIITSTNHSHGQYLPLAGGTMTGSIGYSAKGYCYVGSGTSDAANMVGGELNNLVISSWQGISFTTTCSSTFTSKNAVSIDCRNGVLAAASLRVGNGSGSTINFCTNGGTAAPGAKIVAYNDRIEFVFA